MDSLLPLSTLIFSLLAGGGDPEGSTSDTKSKIIGRYEIFGEVQDEKTVKAAEDEPFEDEEEATA